MSSNKDQNATKKTDTPLYVMLFTAFPEYRNSWGRLDVTALGKTADCSARILNLSLNENSLSKKLAKKLHEAAPDRLPLAVFAPYLLPKL